MARNFAVVPPSPSQPTIRGIDPRKVPTLAAAMPEQVDSLNRSDAFAAREAERQQREQEAALKEQQREAEKARAAAEREAKITKNSAAEADLMGRGVVQYTDARGDIQPVRDPETGNEVFRPKVTKPKWDEQGRAFVIERDETGATRQKFLDANAPIGRNPNDPNDPALYRQNKHSKWDRIDPEEAIGSDDPTLRGAAASHLKQMEAENLKRELQKLNIADDEASATVGRPSKKDLEDAGFDLSSEDPTVKARAQAVIDADKQFRDRAKQKADLGRKMLELDALDNERFSKRFRASVPGRLQAEKKDALMRQREALQKESDALGSEIKSFNQESQKPKTAEESAALQSRFISLNEKQAQIQARQDSHNQEVQRFNDWEKRRQSDAMESRAMGLKKWDADAKAMQPAVAKQQKPLKTVEELSGPVRPGGLRALSFRNDGIELRDGIERLPEILDHPELATQDIYLFPVADDIGAIRANRPAGIERISQARKAIDSRVDEQSKAAKEWIEGKGAEMIQGGQPVSGVENAFAAHMKEWGKQNRQRLLTEVKELSDLQKLTFTGIVPVNQLVSAWKAAGRDARIAPTVTEVLDAAGDKNAQDVGTQKKRSEALDAYIREFRGTPLFNEEEVARMAEKQGKQLLRESLNKNQGWLSAAGGTLRNTMATMGKGLEAGRAVWNYLTGDVEEALTLKDEIEQVDRGLNLNELQTAWSVDNQFGGNFRSFRDYANWLSRVGVEAVPQMLPTIATAGAGSILGQAGGKFFANLGVKGATAELVAKGLTEKAARTAIQKGLLSEAAAGSAGTITKMVQKAAIDRAGAIGMKGGAFLGSLQQNGSELLSNTLAQFTAQDMRERPDDVKRALAGALMLSVPAAALDLMDGNEKALYMAALKEPAKRFHARAGKAMLGAVKEFGLASLKEGGTGFGQSIIGVLNSRQTKGEQMDAPLTKAEVDEIIEGTFAEAAGGGVMHVSTGSIAKAKQLFQSWRAGKSAEIEASKANEAIAAADKNPEVAALIGSVSKNGDVQAFDREIQAATEAYDKAVKSGDSDTALQIRVSLPLLHKAKAQAAAQLVETAMQATAELNAAQAKVEQAIASDPNIQEDSPLFAQLEAVKRARAVARIATGADVATLPDSELRAVGYERGPDGGPKPIKGVVPAVTPAPGGGWVITDEAIKAAEAVSPAARALVKLDERTARIRAALRMQAASDGGEMPAVSPQTADNQQSSGGGKSTEKEQSIPSNLSKFSVTVESPSGKESVIEVEATDSKAASADVAGRGIGMVRDVQQVSGSAARSPIEEALKSFGEGALTATAARVREGKDMTVRRADAIAALRVSPVHTIEDNADGSVRITGVLDPVTKQWVGKAPSPASPQVAPAPAAQTRQQQREAVKAIRAEKDRLEQEFLDKWGLPPLEGDATYEQWKAERVALKEKIKGLYQTPGETIAPDSIDAAAGTPVETKIKALAGNAWDAQGIGDIMNQPQYSAPAIPGLLDARMDAQTLGGRVNLVFEGRAAAEAFMRRIPHGLTYGINDAGGISVVNVRDVAGGTTLTEQALKLSPISTASPAPAPASPIEEALKSFGEGALTATAARVREGKDMTVRRADAIAALRVSPVHTIEDNADGSVRITGVLDPVTKQWVGKAPSPASPQVAPAPAAPTRQQQREAGSAHETKQDRTTIEKAVGQTIGDDLGKIAGDSYEAVKAVFPGGVVVNDGDAGGGVSVEEKDGKITLVVSKKALKAQQDGVGDGMGKWIQAAIVEEAIHAVALSLEKSGKLDATSIWKSLPKVVRDHVVRVYGNASDRNLGHEFLRMVIQNRISINGTKLEVTGDAGISEELAPKTLKTLWKALNAIRKYLVDLVGSLTEAGADKATVKAIKKKADEIEAMLLEMTGANEPATPAAETTVSSLAEEAKRFAGQLSKKAPNLIERLMDMHADGKTAQEIASALGIEVSDVRKLRVGLDLPSHGRGFVGDDDPMLKERFDEWAAKRKAQNTTATAPVPAKIVPVGTVREDNTYESENADRTRRLRFKLALIDLSTTGNSRGTKYQPRERSRVESQAQIVELANSWSPEKALPATSIEHGPIVTTDGNIRSGHGREAALREIYSNDAYAQTAEENRAFLKAYFTQQGMTKEAAAVDKMAMPALAAEIVDFGDYASESDPLLSYVRDANPDEMSRVEESIKNAGELRQSPALVDRLELDANGDFIEDGDAGQAVLAIIEALGLRNKLTRDGRATPELYDTVRQSLLAYVLGADTESGRRSGMEVTLTQLVEDSGDNRTVNFTKALVRSAATLAKIQNVKPEFFTDSLAPAVQKFVAWKQEGGKGRFSEYLEQGDMFAEPTPEDVLRIGRALDSANGLRVLSAVLDSIAEDAAYGGVDLFAAMNAPVTEPIVETVVPAAEPIRETIKKARKATSKAPKTVKAKARKVVEKQIEESKAVPEEDKATLKQEAEQIAPDGSAGRQKTIQAFDGLFSKRLDPLQGGFYSQLARVVAVKMPGRASADHLIGIVSNPQNGIKPEEVKWSGLIPWAKSQPQPLSRDAVVQYLANEGAVKFEEVRKGDAAGNRAKLSAYRRRMRAGEGLQGVEQREYERLASFDDDGGDDSKYSQYQLPGGKNYREVVLSMQRKFTSDQQKTPKQLAKEMFGADSIYDLTAEQQRQLMARNEVKDRPYTSSHFPDVPNYVAHTRLNEREDSTGEAGLFIEELQSDRHQAGREKGYKSDSIEFYLKAKNGGQNAGPFDSRESADFANDGSFTVETREPLAGIPDAPFRTTWPVALFKRALRDAVGSGSPAWKDATKPERIGELSDNFLGGKYPLRSSLGPVEAGVLRLAGKHNQVRRAIVAAVPVNMVRDLASHKLTPEQLFGGSDVVWNTLPVNRRSDVANGVRDALVKTAADLRAALNSVLSGGRDQEVLPALKASVLAPGEVVGLLSPFSSANFIPVQRGVESVAASGGAKLGSELAGDTSSAELANLLNRHAAIIHGRPVDSIQIFKPSFSWLGWTSGETQADRFDLSKQVDEVVYYSDTQDLQAFKGGKEVIFQKGVSKESLPDYIGKEAANKLLNSPTETSPSKNGGENLTLKGEDLKIGGSGMAGFYDGILPKEISKYVKQWGAKVERGETDGTPIWKVSITPKMADSVSKGQPLFSRRISEKEDAEYLAAVERGDMETAQRMVDAAARKWIETAPAIKAGDDSDGRTVTGEPPNAGSIGASLNDWESFGIRDVPYGWVVGTPGKEQRLAEAIQESGEIAPLIIVVDGHKDGAAYVLEGAHRIDALATIGAKSFPALVIYDKSSDPVTRDESGNVIPLSKRFDSGSDSILYSKPLVTYRKALPNDKERRAKMIDAAETLIAEGVKTPDGLAEVLDGISKSLREYSQTFWSFFTQLDETLEYVPDWQAVYDKRDGIDAKQSAAPESEDDKRQRVYAESDSSFKALNEASDAQMLALDNVIRATKGLPALNLEQQTDASIEADRAKAEAAAKKKQQQQAIDAAAAAPLTGKDTTGQGALFADDPANDLFSGPSAEQIFNNPEANTSPETVQATTEPNASNEEGQKEGRQALLNNGGVASAASPTPTSSGLSDFGEKLGGARKDKAAKRVITDADYEKMSLSEIWPKSEVDSIEDTALASLAHSIRDSIPTKPQKGYKVKSWAENVKTVLGLVDVAMEKGFDFVIQQMASNRVLSGLAAKAKILQQLPRAQWSRIGNVEWWPDAYSFKTDESGKTVTGEDGKVVRVFSPFGSIEIDKGRFRGKSVEELEAKAKEFLEGAKTERKIEFEVRGREGVGYYINKKGDALRRKLKSFDNSQDALKFARAPENYDELAAAWDGIKETDNVKETDVRRAENRPRRGDDYRKGADATPEMFMSTFGFRGVEFGNWVSQGKNAKERQGMLNAAYDALMDLASITGFPARAISLNGSLGLGLGSRGSGWASAHYEPRLIVINLTKTRGAGSLAHEWFHALDNYFQRQRNATGIAYGEGDYITKEPENYYQDSRGYRISETRFNQVRLKKENWKLVEGVRPEVAAGFAALVKTLDASPMAKRASLLDKGKTKYWSDIIERAARSFENFIIARMMQDGYHNDYLANVVSVEDFARDAGRYPYLLADEIQPVKEAFESLLGAIKTKETDKGLALYSARINPPNLHAALKAREKLRAITDPSPSQRESLRRVEEVILREERKLGQAMMFRDEEVIPSRPLQTAKFEQMALFAKSLRDSGGKVTPAQDAEYMAAVESGDMEAAQRMVDEAAKAAGFMRKVWRGDSKQITKFDREHLSSNFTSALGFSFTTDKVTAESYGSPAQYYIDTRKTWRVDYIEDRGVSDDAFGYDEEELAALLGADGIDVNNEDEVNEWWDNLGKTVIRIDNIDDSSISGTGVYSGDPERKATLYIVRNPSQIKSADPVTRDDAGDVIPLSQRFDSGSDSILYAKSFRKELEDAGMDIGMLDAATDRARQEKPGQRTVGRPDLALGALDPVIMGVDETRIVEEQTFEQWDAEARQMLRNDYEATVKRIQEIGRSGMELDPALTRAAQMIVARESRKKMNPAQQRRLQWLVYSYRNSRTQTARSLAAGRDPFMTPEDRHREFLMKIIFTPTKEVRDRLEMAEGIEEKERIMKEQRDELERIKKELARLGISLDDIFSGSVSLVLKNDPIVAKLTASLDAKQRGVVPLLQKGMAFKDIARATGLREDAVTALHTDLRTKAKAEVLARLRAMRDSAKSALKSARINDDGGAIVDAAALAGMSDAEAEAAMQQIAEQMVQQMGFLPVEKQGKMKPSRRKARKPIFQVPPRREPAPADESIQPGEGRTKGDELDLGNTEGMTEDEIKRLTRPVERTKPGTQPRIEGLSPAADESIQPGEGRTKGDELDLGNTEGMTEDEIKRLTRPVERTKPGTQPRIEGLSPAADESITGDAEEWSTKGLFPEAWDAWDGEQLVPVGADLTDIADVVSVARAAQIARASGLDMLQEWYINNLLSGPSTQVRNITGNVTSLVVSKTLVRGVETLLRGQPKEMVYLWKGLIPGIARGWKLAKMAWLHQADFTKSDFLNAQMEFDGLIKGEGYTPAIPGKFGDGVRVFGRMLAFIDSLFMGIIGQMEAGAQAYRIAKSQGLSGNALVKKMHSEINTPGSMAWQLALQKAEEATFKQKLRKMDAHKNYGAAYSKAGAEGLTGEVRKLRAKILMGSPPSGPIIGYAARALEEGALRLSNFANSVILLKFIVPFIGTPYNILRTGIRMSPAGGLVLAEELLSGGWIKWRRGKAMTETHPQMIQHAAEQIIGWTAALLLAGAVEGDDDDEDQWLLITGTRQKGAQADLQARSYPATSIRIFGKWFNYGSIEPIATTIGVIADAVRAKKTGSGSLISSLRGQIDGKTFLKGLADTWDNVERMAEGKTDIKAESIKFALTALVPNLVRQPLRASDDLERDWKAKEWWHDALPYGGGAAPKIDATTGEPVKKPGNFATRLLFPFLVAPPEQIAASDRMLIEWNRQNPNAQWAPDEASRILDVKQPGGGKVRVELNGKAYEYLQKRAAAVTKLRLPSYRPNPDERTIKAIKDAYEEGRTKAREELRRWSLEKLGTVK